MTVVEEMVVLVETLEFDVAIVVDIVVDIIDINDVEDAVVDCVAEESLILIELLLALLLVLLMVLLLVLLLALLLVLLLAEGKEEDPTLSSTPA